MDVPAKKTAADATARPAPPTRQVKAAPVEKNHPTTLLDMQEVEWITRELERLLAKEQQQTGGDDGGWHRRKRAKVSPAPTKKKGGFLADFLGRHAVSICSGTASGVNTARGRRLLPRGGRGRRSFREVEKV